MLNCAFHGTGFERAGLLLLVVSGLCFSDLLAADEVAANAGFSPKTHGQWQLVTESEASAVVGPGALDPNVLSVRLQTSPRGRASDVSLRHALTLAPAQDFEVRFQARAQWRRGIQVRLEAAGTPEPEAGTEVILGAQYSKFQLPFRSPVDTGVDLSLCFDLGADLAGVEITDVQIVQGEKTHSLQGSIAAVTLVSEDPPRTDADAAGSKPAVAASPPANDQPPPEATASKPATHQLITHQNAAATVKVLPSQGEEPSRLRLEISNPGQEPWHIQLVAPCPAVEVGQEYVVRIRIRGDQERKVGIAASRNQPDWANLGLYENRTLTPKWQELSLKFRAELADAKPRIEFDAGGDPVAIEIASISFHAGDKSVELLDLPAKAVAKSDPPAPDKKGPQPPTAPGATRWNLSLAAGGEATIETPPGEPPSTHVRISNPGDKIYSVQLNYPGLEFRKGANCQLSMELRASEPRGVSVAVSHSGAKNNGLGLYDKQPISKEWKKYTFTFHPTEDSNSARIHLDLGLEKGDVEVRNVQLTVDGKAGSLTVGEVVPDADAPVIPAPDQGQTQTLTTPLASLQNDWEFSPGNLKASLIVHSVSPWEAEMTIESSSAAAGRAILRRKLDATDKAKLVGLRFKGRSIGTGTNATLSVEVRLLSAQKTVATYRVELKQEWQEERFEIPSASASPDRLEILAGPTPVVVGVSDIR